MKDEEKDYEWNYDDGNRYRSSGRRLSSVSVSYTHLTLPTKPIV